MSKHKESNVIRLRGVRHNNLKGFDLDLPLGKLVVMTGLSGSGKSSLAFDTLYAEGQRRYIETFSPYARQFFDRMDKPQVDSIEGIPPAIAVEQRNAVRSTRSTVGTMTEICDHMKVLWPHIAQLHCRQCGTPVRKEPPQAVWKTVNAEGRVQNAELLITFDLPLSEKLSPDESLALIARQGYQRLLVGKNVVRLDDAAQHVTHHASRIPSLTVVQDRLRATPANRSRFMEACEQAYHFGKGRLRIHRVTSEGHLTQHATRNRPIHFSNKLHCATCDLDYPDPSPALFSFNHPVGACPACKGFGRIITIDYNLAIPDRSKTLAAGAIKPWQSGMSAECQRDMLKFCRASGVPSNVPFRDLSEEHQRWIIDGDPDYGIDEEHEWPRAWYGVKGYFRWLESKAYKMHVRVLLSRYRAYSTCPDCHGARLNPDALLYQFTQDTRRNTLADFYTLPISRALHLIGTLTGGMRKSAVRNPPSGIEHALEEVRSRLRYLNEIGLGYLTLDRATRSLSGGETERVNLATCLGTRLVNTLFVLDEPTVGLHPRDTDRLVTILKALRDEGNTVVVVEHERSAMEAADQIVDLGPGHGATGGELVFQGSHARILKSKASLTGKYLSGETRIEIPARRAVENPKHETRNPRELRTAKTGSRAGATRVRGSDTEHPSDPELRTSHLPWLRLAHASRHNLKNLSIEIPLNRFVCVSGVSGSGKSTLIREVLLPALQGQLGGGSDPGKASDRLQTETSGDEVDALEEPPDSTRLTGAEHLGNVVLVDQTILGKTPRSNPAVYTGAFDHIRELFAQCEDARQQGLNASAFSFNSSQGQCERCRGAGFEKVEMQFLSDVFIRCPDCNGRRYREHILEVRMQSAECRSEQAGEATPPSSRNTSVLRRNATEDRQHATPSLSIADVLESTVDEVITFLQGFPDSKPARKALGGLRLLQEVGLGYLALGQPINTLSGGECQRLKLVRHLADATIHIPKSEIRHPKEARLAGSDDSSLAKRTSDVRPTLFLLDEPTTGLHFEDVRILLNALQRLVDAGHSLVVIEHNLDVLKCADWIIDLGPEAGDAGGSLVVAGTPETVAACNDSHTGTHLKGSLNQRAFRNRRCAR